MANLVPENRMEQILAGENITPVNRTEYFVKEAIDNAGSGGGSDLPTPGADGNVLTADNGDWVSAAPVSELPAVTNDDNGDVLTVVEGDWAKAPAPESGKTVILTADLNYLTYAISNPSMTYTEVGEAVSAGKSVVLRLSITGTAQTVDYYLANNIGTAYVFMGNALDPNGNVVGVIYYRNDGTFDAGMISAPMIIDLIENGGDARLPDYITLSTLYNLANNGVVIEANLDGIRLPLGKYNYDSQNDEYEIVFANTMPLSTGATATLAYCYVRFDNATTATPVVYTWTGTRPNP